MLEAKISVLDALDLENSGLGSSSHGSVNFHSPAGSGTIRIVDQRNCVNAFFKAAIPPPDVNGVIR